MESARYKDEEIYDYFDDSDVEDFDNDDQIDGFDYDEVVEMDNEETDPLWIENLLESSESAEHNDTNCTEKHDIKWKRGMFRSQELPFKPHQVQLPDSGDQSFNPKSPLEYFKSYFTDELFEKFAMHTNEYATQQNRSSFTPTNSSEMKILFGLHIMMGWIKLPRVSLYWSNLLNLKTFKESMTSERFFQLRTNLHIVNNLEKPKNNVDKFYKVRPVLDAVRDRLLRFEVEEIVSVDEQMIPLKNRLVMKQYMKDKPSKWGCKVYLLCGKSGIPSQIAKCSGGCKYLNGFIYIVCTTKVL